MSLQEAQNFEDNGQYTEAYEKYKKSLLKNPRDLGIMERLGHLAMMLNLKNEAADYYSKILEFDATNTMAYEQLADIYADTDRYKYYIARGNLRIAEQKPEQALSDYKKALSQAKEDAEIIPARFVLATLYEQLGQNHKAIDEFLKLSDCDNTNEEVYTKLANLYVKENAAGAAADVLECARKAGFDTPKVRESLAQLYLSIGNPKAAMELSANELTKITALFDEGNMKQAWELIQQNEKQYKHDGEFLSLKARYYYETDDNEKALEAVKEFEKFVKNSPLAYQMRALIYERQDDDFNASLNWGRYHLVRGSKDIAINEFLDAYRINPDNADLVSALAALYEQTGDKNYAREFYEKLLQLEPENKNAREKLADFQEEDGIFDKFMKFFGKA